VAERARSYPEKPLLWKASKSPRRTDALLLDTHAWIWWLTSPGKLGRKAKRAIAKADRVGIPSICVWEIAMKAQAGNLRFDRPYETWIEEALTEDSRTELLHLLPRISVSGLARCAWD